MRRKGSERRLRFFDRGKTMCPICLERFSRERARKGREVTLEHAPPKTLGGVEMCLTCTSCNRSAGSSLDQAAALAHRIGEEQSAGHGVRVLLEVCGIKRTTYFRPEGFRGAGSSLARNPAAKRFLTELPSHDVVALSVEMPLRQDSGHCGRDLFGREVVVQGDGHEGRCVVVNQEDRVCTLMPVGPRVPLSEGGGERLGGLGLAQVSP